MEFSLLLVRLAVTIVEAGAGLVTGAGIVEFLYRAARRRARQSELKAMDPETREVNEVLDEIAARRFPSLAGR